MVLCLVKLTCFAIVDDARPMASKYLAKFRPAFLEAASNMSTGEGATTAAVPAAAAVAT